MINQFKMFGNTTFLLLGCTILLCTRPVSSQAQDSSLTIAFQLQQNYVKAVDSKLDEFGNHADQYSVKTLDKIISQERKMQRKVAKTDSLLAKKLFSYSIDSLQKLKACITGNISPLQKYAKPYLPYLDTLKQSLKFLGSTDKVTGQAHKVQQQLESTLVSVNGIEAKLDGIENIEHYLSQRQEVLKGQLKQYPQLANNLKRINKQAYYYSAQVRQYKQTLQDPSRVEETVLREVQKLPAFQQFMQHNSALSGVFASPFSFSSLLNGVSMPVVNGLPSRASLQAFIQANVPAGKFANPVQHITQQLPELSSAANQLKSKINGMGAGSSASLPDFKPNTQRTQSLWKRLEYGADLQFGKSVSYLPATAAIAAKLGYKLNDKSSIGGGASYMMGLGSGWKNIRFSTQAIGLRTYVTWKLKKGLDLQGGSEWNYMLQLKNPAFPEQPDKWQQSALLGIRKKYAAGKKLKGNVQVLYDFLYNRHMPVSQPVVFRFGYSL